MLGPSPSPSTEVGEIDIKTEQCLMGGRVLVRDCEHMFKSSSGRQVGTRTLSVFGRPRVRQTHIDEEAA